MAGTNKIRLLGPTPVPVILLSGLLFLWPWTALADIYRYVDPNGVLHFTNVPTSSKYSLYLKEKPGRAAVRVSGSRRFDNIIHKAARATGLEFALIKAVIGAESGFDPAAVSLKGASGLMQIMPGNFAFLDISDPFDPAQNIMGGSRYLKSMMDRYQNRLPMALAAYNAGPDAVDNHRGIPPFRETIAYVHKVMGLYKSYRR
jgi:soluble lytic murein transglycosylase